MDFVIIGYDGQFYPGKVAMSSIMITIFIFVSLSGKVLFLNNEGGEVFSMTTIGNYLKLPEKKSLFTISWRIY